MGNKTQVIYVYSWSALIFRVFWFLFHVATAMIGHHIHGGFWWTLFDWIFAPFVLVKWLICHDVNITIIKETFNFFLQ